MISTSIIVQSVLGIVVSIVLFYLIGRIFNYLLNSKKVYWGWIPTYFYLLCGMLLSVSAFAIFKTKGITVLAMFPVLLVFLSKSVNNHFVFEKLKGTKEKIIPFLYLFSSVAIAYLYYLQSFKVEGEIINYIWGDVEFYSRVAENISQLGVENLRVEYLYPERFSVEPYHYGDLWTIAFVSVLSNVLPVYAVVLIATPILLGIATLGAASFVHHFILKNDRNLLLLLVILLGFVGGFSFFFPKFLFPGAVDIYDHSLNNYTKLAWWATMLPFIYILLMNKSDEVLPILIFIIGFGYITVFPSLLMVCFIWLGYIGYIRGEIKKYLKNITVLTIVGILFLYFLYSLIPAFFDLKNDVSSKPDVSLLTIISNYRTSINIFIGGGMQFLVYLPVFLIVIIYNKIEGANFTKSSIINVVLFSLLTLFSGLLTWSVLFTLTFEAIQFFYNIFVVVAGLLSVVIYIYVIINSRIASIKLAAVLLLCISTIGNWKYTFNVKSIKKIDLNTTFNFIDSHSPKTFAYYLPHKDYTIDVFSSSTVVARPLSFLGYKIPYYQNYSLNVPFAKLDSTKREYPYQKNNIAWAPMSYFIQQPENVFLSEDELMQKFMRQNNIGFLCLPVDVIIPSSLNGFVIDSLFSPGVGWKIYKCTYK